MISVNSCQGNRKDFDHVGAALDLFVEPFLDVSGVDPRPVLLGEEHVCQDVVFGLDQPTGKL